MLFFALAFFYNLFLGLYLKDFLVLSALPAFFLLTNVRSKGVRAVIFFSACHFVYKPETPHFLNGRATLWDTETEELADEICAGCDTGAEKLWQSTIR